MVQFYGLYNMGRKPYKFVPISSMGIIISSSIVFFRSIFECAWSGISSIIAGSEVNSDVISEVNSDVISEDVWTSCSSTGDRQVGAFSDGTSVCFLSKIHIFENKAERVFPVVTWSEFRLGQLWDNDYREDAPHFIIKMIELTIWRTQKTLVHVLIWWRFTVPVDFNIGISIFCF